MLLSERKNVVDALKSILENIPYLEYSQERSHGHDYLHIEVTDPTVHNIEAVMRQIGSKLKKDTGLSFMEPSKTPTMAFFRIRKLPV